MLLKLRLCEDVFNCVQFRWVFTNRILCFDFEGTESIKGWRLLSIREVTEPVVILLHLERGLVHLALLSLCKRAKLLIFKFSKAIILGVAIIVLFYSIFKLLITALIILALSRLYRSLVRNSSVQIT